MNLYETWPKKRSFIRAKLTCCRKPKVSTSSFHRISRGSVSCTQATELPIPYGTPSQKEIHLPPIDSQKRKCLFQGGPGFLEET